MPRKKKVKEFPTSGPATLADVLEQSPVAAMIADHEANAPTLDGFLASREAKSQIDPERQMPEPDQRHREQDPPPPRPEKPSLPDTDPDMPTLQSSNGKPRDADEALAAFQRQREREQVVEPLPVRGDLPPPQTEVIPSQNRPDRVVKSWGETVRGWTSHGSTGVRHVTTTSPDMVGIAFRARSHAPTRRSGRWRTLASASSKTPRRGSRPTGMGRLMRPKTSPAVSPSDAVSVLRRSSVEPDWRVGKAI